VPSIPSQEAFARLARAPVGTLATVRPDGTPHVVPFVFAVRGRTLYWAVDRKPKRTTDLQRLANIRAIPAVSVLVDHYEDDWTRLWWVRADGTARILDAGEERNGAIELLRRRYARYRDAPPDGPAVAIEVRRCTGWRASDAV
jgi:PPOX class probable F420-dependent enzyme